MAMKVKQDTLFKTVAFELTHFIYGFLLIFGLIIFSYSLSAAQEELRVGHFSNTRPGDGLPDGWEPLLFKRIEQHTKYTLVKDSGQTVVRADSKASSSGLIRHVQIDPKKYSTIEWRWKISNTYEKGDVTRKEGDDYPARIYIAFEFDPKEAGTLERTKYRALEIIFGKKPPVAAINYIWASKALEGTVVPSPYTGQSMMIVVQSGEAKTNQWITVKRDIVADYMAAFGEKPPMISAIAIMTDSNDTGEAAIGYYGDIVMKAQTRGFSK